MKKHILSFFPAAIVLVSLFILWQIEAQLGVVSLRILPSPLQVSFALVGNWQIILEHSFQTLLEALIGLMIATFFAWIIAFCIDRSARFKKAVYPLLIVSQTIPMIALAPLLLVWFGFDMLPKILIVILYCFFPITVALADGFSSVSPDTLAVLKSMRASVLQIYLLAKIPASSPQFFSGLKIAATYAIIGAIVGEYVGAEKGLGIFMQQAANSYAISLVFAGIFVTAVLSMLLVAAILVLEKIFLTWRN